MTSQELLATLERCLIAGAADSTSSGQRLPLAPVAEATAIYAEAVARSEETWEPARTWARLNAHLAISAYSAFESWSSAIAGIFYSGGEEEIERALIQRSQLELVRHLFSGTEAEEVLAPITSEEVEADYRQAAARLHLEAPSWVPRSHSWWYWRDQ